MSYQYRTYDVFEAASSKKLIAPLMEDELEENVRKKKILSCFRISLFLESINFEIILRKKKMKIQLAE